MTLSSHHRRNIVLQAEGMAINQAGSVGSDLQADITRAQIDGLFNALIRMEGRETAAGYAFTVGDRVAGGLREPTDFRLPKVELVQPAPPPPLPPVIEPEPKWWHPTPWRWGFVYGVLVGMLIAICGMGVRL